MGKQHCGLRKAKGLLLLILLLLFSMLFFASVQAAAKNVVDNTQTLSTATMDALEI